MKKLKLLATAGTLTLAATLVGCGSSKDHDMGSMSNPSTTAPPMSSTAPPATSTHNDADVMFAQMMIPHHHQAIEMADMILAKQGIDSDVTTLATQIKSEQTPEIDQMNGWLTDWGQSTSPMPMDHAMSGTMSQSEMDALAAASGDRAATLFLSGMVKHHQGAITMARDESAHGQNTDAQKLARSIEDTQQAEIDQMNDLLKR